MSVGQEDTEQLAIPERVVKVTVMPEAASVSVIGNVPALGAVTLLPEAVHVGTLVPAQKKGTQFPPGQDAQLMDVDVLAQLYGPVPPVTLSVPALLQTDMVPQVITVMVVVPTPQAKL